MISRTALALAALCAAPTFAAEPQQMTYADLAERLTDMEHLAVLPAEGERGAMYSSYDRRSAYNEETGHYEHWLANGDGRGRVETLDDGRHVLADIEGPGVIWRIWSADPRDGKIEFVIDGEKAIDVPFKALFDGTTAPFDHGSLSYTTRADGANAFVPIPFQESVRIVADPDWGRYFQFSYTTYPQGTQLPTFSMDLGEEDAAALAQAAKTLGGDASQIEAPGDAETMTQSVDVPAGGAATVAELDGPRAIVGLKIDPEDFANKAEAEIALATTMLRVTWDGEDNPSVLAPLGNFFGSPMGLNPHNSYPAGVSDDGVLYSRWYMPFGESAKIELVNDGEHGRTFDVTLMHEPLDRDAGAYGRFHAKYTRGHRVERADLWPDWTFLDTQGRGRFVGMGLHVWNGTGKGHNRKYALDGGHWWGEGDEKLFVDGETTPSTFGTGTEDYFGYAWCNPNYFENAYHGQPLTQNNYGHQAVHRYQVAENVPFQKSFDGAMEKYYGDEWPTRYGAVVYWYLDEDGTDPFTEKPTVEDRLGYFDMTPAYEGENLPVKDVTGGEVETQTLLDNRQTGESLWSGGTQLWWKGGQIGDKLTIGVPVVNAGKYRVLVGSTRAHDYVEARFTFDGQSPLAPYNFNNNELYASEHDLGVFDLDRGVYDFVVEITGINDRAKQDRFFGLDYVKLVPVPADETAGETARR